MQFIEKRKWFYILSSLIIIPGIISMIIQGFNLGIDFRGGTVLHYRMGSPVSVAEVRATVSDLNLVKDVNVQQSGREFYLRTSELDQTQTEKMTQGLTDRFKEVELLSADSVGATIGSELTRNAFLAVFIALILMLIYISFRFELVFGVAAVLSLLHDVLIVCGLFSLFQWEINSTFIAAILTIIGYSINDTIVIFDRVRENLRQKKREALPILLNKSIMQTLNRSVNTVLTSLLPLITLLLFGGGTIKVFIMTLVIGFIFGAYSSICVASPIYYEIKARG